MVLLTPAHLSVSPPTDAYTAQVSDRFHIVTIHQRITRFKDLLAALSILQLPSSIKHLHVGFSQTYTAVSTTNSQEELFSLKNRLFLSYCALQRIQFDLSGFYVSWSRVDLNNV